MRLLVLVLCLFLPPAPKVPSGPVRTEDIQSSNTTKTIKVNFQEMVLVVNDSFGKVIGKFPVALPQKTPPLPIKGLVKNIELNATWYPTQKTREWYLKKKKTELPEVIPPGHPLNAVGIGKISIIFEDPGVNALVRIHGTNDPASIGTRITRGCIRLKNEDFFKLVNLVGKEKVFVLFE